MMMCQLRELKSEAEKEARDTREELRRQRALWRQQVCFVFNLFNFRCHRKAKSHRGRRGLGFRVSVFSFFDFVFRCHRKIKNAQRKEGKKRNARAGKMIFFPPTKSV